MIKTAGKSVQHREVETCSLSAHKLDINASGLHVLHINLVQMKESPYHVACIKNGSKERLFLQ